MQLPLSNKHTDISCDRHVTDAENVKIHVITFNDALF